LTRATYLCACPDAIDACAVCLKKNGPTH
jgi:hypothetical protein